jgi:copper(I)-binding protein
MAAALFTACGGAEEEAPLEDTGAEVDGGAVGPDVTVSEETGLHQVQLEYPSDGLYEVGDDARLFLGISNSGTEPVRLVEIVGPDFSGVQVETAEGAGLPLQVDPNDNLYIGAEGPPTVTLLDLERRLRSSQSIPVTFAFADAGEVTVDVVVSASDQDPAPPFDFPVEEPDPDPTEDDA